MKQTKATAETAVEQVNRKAAKAIADQAVVHHSETIMIVGTYLEMKMALAEAVKTIDWLRSIAFERWTPADAQKLEQWRELVR